MTSKIGTHNAFINFNVESNFQLSKLIYLLVMRKSILIYQNSRTKTRLREVPIMEKGFISTKISIYFFVDSDPNLALTQNLAVKLTSNLS